MLSEVDEHTLAKTAEKMNMPFREEYADEKNALTSVYSITRAEYYVIV